MTGLRVTLAAAAIALSASPALADATAVATYLFQNTFAAQQAGAPALTPLDPQATSAFVTDTVEGASRTVWNFNGLASPPASQAGFTLNTSSLLTSPTSYSVDMLFLFTQRENAWRRILDVENRQSDSGLYVDPTNNLDIFPVSGSTAAWTNNVYHHIVLTDDNGTVNVYLDGLSQFTTTTTVMDLNQADNPSHLLGAFLDNTTASGLEEWSPGNISLFRLWDGVLTPQQAQALATNPFVPEPATLSLLALTAPLLLLRRRQAQR
jgi:hypothetical protein